MPEKSSAFFQAAPILVTTCHKSLYVLEEREGEVRLLYKRNQKDFSSSFLGAIEARGLTERKSNGHTENRFPHFETWIRINWQT